MGVKLIQNTIDTIKKEERNENMPFEGLGQDLYNKARKMETLEVFIFAVECGELTINDAIAKMHISEAEYNVAANAIKNFSNNKDEHYRQASEFMQEHQDIFEKMADL